MISEGNLWFSNSGVDVRYSLILHAWYIIIYIMAGGDRVARNIRYFFDYIRDKDTPFYKKALIVGSMLYFILPTDIVPDYILGIGWLDDAAVAAFIWNAVRTEVGDYIIKKKRLYSKVINLEEKRNKH
jgi:uncharacterized membrane protein YkvA (DUF1232 family)